MSIPGNVFDCQHARRDSDELHYTNDSRNLATSSAMLNTEGIEKSDSEELLHAINTFILFLGKSKGHKCLNGGTCPMFMTNRVVGIGTCIQGMTIPSYLSSKMHLQKFPDETEFQNWVVNFRAEVRAKARNKRKGTKFLRRAEDWRMFSAEDNWVVFHGRP